MSSRPQFQPFSVMTNASMGADIVSAVTIILKMSLVSYGITWSAGSTPVGTISVEVSNDYSQNADGSVRNSGSWAALPLDSSTAVSGNSGTGFIDIDINSAYAIRLKYTRTSGSGTMNAIVNCKVT